MSEQTEGWAYLPKSKRLHWVKVGQMVIINGYEVLGASICRNWPMFRDDAWNWSTNPQPADCCKACVKALAKREADCADRD